MSAIYVALCAVVFYASFCRLVLVNSSTWVLARMAFCAVLAGAALGVFSVVLWGYRPGLVAVVQVATMAGMLLVSSRRWRSGVPDEYQAEVPT